MGGKQGTIAIDNVKVYSTASGLCPAERECTFQGSLCGLLPQTSTNFSWSRITGKSQPANSSGPITDHTLGTEQGLQLLEIHSHQLICWCFFKFYLNVLANIVHVCLVCSHQHTVYCGCLPCHSLDWSDDREYKWGSDYQAIRLRLRNGTKVKFLCYVYVFQLSIRPVYIQYVMLAKFA